MVNRTQQAVTLFFFFFLYSLACMPLCMFVPSLHRLRPTPSPPSTMFTTSKHGPTAGQIMTDDDNPPRNKKSLSSHPSKALTDPQVLRTVGLDLTIADLQSCRLVSHFWHTHFSPFIYWIQLEDLNAIMRRIEKYSSTSSRTRLDERYQAQLSELEHRVKLPSAAFDFHSARRKFLNSGDMKSRLSFL